eukprot:2942674-Heterocapsa_arctica.AAC.1
MARSLGTCEDNETYQDAITGRSGGVAILTWNGRLILNNTFESDYRAVGASIGWGRKETLHIFSIYGFDLGQNISKGRVIMKEAIYQSETD